MEGVVVDVLNEIGVKCQHVADLDGVEISRDIFVSDIESSKFDEMVGKLKKYLSSSSLTALQTSASQSQRWPVLNLARQVLRTYRLHMVPVRKCDGRTPEGKKKFKRFFRIERQN